MELEPITRPLDAYAAKRELWCLVETPLKRCRRTNERVQSGKLPVNQSHNLRRRPVSKFEALVVSIRFPN